MKFIVQKIPLKKYLKKIFKNQCLNVSMSLEEKNMFLKYISDSKTYLEFGSGGSTFNALLYSNAKVYSVESSKEWIERLNKLLFIKWNKFNNRLKLFHINIGNTGDWGYPIDDSEKDSYPRYSSYIFSKIEKSDFDTVLIDGRFRVACILQTILNAVDADTKIIIHDFWNREHYHIVLKYLDVIDKVGTLGVFKLKKNLNKEEVLSDYEQFKYISK